MSEQQVPSDAVPSKAEAGLPRQILDAHLGRLIAGITFVFTIPKILSVAHFDTTTALGVVAESSTSSLVVGALVTAIDPVLLAFTAALLAVAAGKTAMQDPDGRVYGALGGIFAFLTAALAPWWQAPVFILPLVLLIRRVAWNHTNARHFQELEKETDALQEADKSLADTAVAHLVESEEAIAQAKQALDEMEDLTALTPEDKGRRASLDDKRHHVADLESRADLLHRKSVEMHDSVIAAVSKTAEIVEANRQLLLSTQQAEARGMKRVLQIMAVVYALTASVALLSDNPWLPAERIVADGQPSVTGYVVHADHDQIIVLVEDSRLLRRIDVSKVQSRRFCRVVGATTSWARRPLVSFLFDVPSYPDCHRLSS